MFLRFLSVTRRALPQVLPLLRNGQVPFWLKAAAAFAALLIVSPIDLFGDLPVVGFLDDAVLLALVVNGFVALALGFAVREPELMRVPVVKRVTPL